MKNLIRFCLCLSYINYIVLLHVGSILIINSLNYQFIVDAPLTINKQIFALHKFPHYMNPLLDSCFLTF